MDYQSSLEFLYNQLPAFHREGASAYKPGLETVRTLSEAFGAPHSRLRCVHVAGTNGKGSTSHTLAAILQKSGYRVGLFTSPHILDFRERIRVNGCMISDRDVTDFVERYRAMDLTVEPSFFELTTVMAFDYFQRQDVDVAVIEVGLGGRLDSTNIIRPLLSVITNISLDHTSLLGSTLVEIAGEKGGIIKKGIPVVIGEAEGDVKKTFLNIAAEKDSPVVCGSAEIISAAVEDEMMVYDTRSFGTERGALTGDYQKANAGTVLEAVKTLRASSDLVIPDSAVREGFESVVELTGLAGRWMKLSDSPLTVCDTGHNPGGWEYLSRQIDAFKGHKRVVLGFVNDKDVSTILDMLRDMDNVTFYFTAPSPSRALPVDELVAIARERGIIGVRTESVREAYEKALADVVDKSSEMLFIGGSTFVVADLMEYLSSGQR